MTRSIAETVSTDSTVDRPRSLGRLVLDWLVLDRAAASATGSSTGGLAAAATLLGRGPRWLGEVDVRKAAQLETGLRDGSSSTTGSSTTGSSATASSATGSASATGSLDLGSSGSAQVGQGRRRCRARRQRDRRRRGRRLLHGDRLLGRASAALEARPPRPPARPPAPRRRDGGPDASTTTVPAARSPTAGGARPWRASPSGRQIVVDDAKHGPNRDLAHPGRARRPARTTRSFISSLADRLAAHPTRARRSSTAPRPRITAASAPWSGSPVSESPATQDHAAPAPTTRGRRVPQARGGCPAWGPERGGG